MSYEWMIARRHLRSIRRRRQVSLTVLIAVTGVMIGVAALVIVLSVFNGFSELLWKSLLGVNPHLTVQKSHGAQMADYMRVVDLVTGQPDVVGAAPFIGAEGFLLRRPPGGEGVHSGVLIRGLTAEGLAQVTDIETYMWAGELDFGVQPASGRGRVYGMVIGRSLADRLGVMLGVEVHLGLLPKGMLMGQTLQWRRYAVTGIFSTGLDELDSAVAFISLQAARRDLGWGNQVTGIHLRLRDPYAAGQIKEVLRPVLSPAAEVGLVSWMDTHKNLYASIRLEKWYSFLVLCLIVTVAGFNIISILTMTVAERQQEIGILKAMGATPQSIGRVFTLEGLVVGLLGVTLGNVIGFVLCWVQQTFAPIQLPGQLYIVSALPVEMYPADFGLISVSAVALCYVFTRFPARDAAGLDPVEALRRE